MKGLLIGLVAFGAISATAKDCGRPELNLTGSLSNLNLNGARAEMLVGVAKINGKRVNTSRILPVSTVIFLQEAISKGSEVCFDSSVDGDIFSIVK